VFCVENRRKPGREEHEGGEAVGPRKEGNIEPGRPEAGEPEASKKRKMWNRGKRVKVRLKKALELRTNKCATGTLFLRGGNLVVVLPAERGGDP